MFIDWSKLCCLILQQICLHKSGCNLNTVKKINKFQKLGINGIIISNVYILYMYRHTYREIKREHLFSRLQLNHIYLTGSRATDKAEQRWRVNHKTLPF